VERKNNNGCAQGVTENVRQKKYGTVKNAGPENARHEFATPTCKGGKCET